MDLFVLSAYFHFTTDFVIIITVYIIHLYIKTTSLSLYFVFHFQLFTLPELQDLNQANVFM